jgi:NitT/TauT family transport system ATP-binding protein
MQTIARDLLSPLLKIEDLTLAYNQNSPIFKNVSFHVNQGEFISVIGPSGCGKSSLLNLIAGFLAPTSGQIFLNDDPIKVPGPDRAVVFQDLALFPWLNVIENVSLGLKIQGISKKEQQEKSLEILKIVGLERHASAKVSDLSGGMKQRVAIARALVTHPKVLLMDEPFSALDAQTREELHDELLRIQNETKMTIILITHSIDEAVYLSDRVFAMKQQGGFLERPISIELNRPRHGEMRVSSHFNSYKKSLMDALKTGHMLQDGIDNYQI